MRKISILNWNCCDIASVLSREASTSGDSANTKSRRPVYVESYTNNIHRKIPHTPRPSAEEKMPLNAAHGEPTYSVHLSLKYNLLKNLLQLTYAGTDTRSFLMNALFPYTPATGALAFLPLYHGTIPHRQINRTRPLTCAITLLNQRIKVDQRTHCVPRQGKKIIKAAYRTVH